LEFLGIRTIADRIASLRETRESEVEELLCESAVQGNAFGAVNYGLQLAKKVDINQSISFLKCAMNEGNSFAQVLLFEWPDNTALVGLSKMPLIQVISYFEIIA
jgi:hypothetical protein